MVTKTKRLKEAAPAAVADTPITDAPVSYPGKRPEGWIAPTTDFRPKILPSGGEVVADAVPHPVSGEYGCIVKIGRQAVPIPSNKITIRYLQENDLAWMSPDGHVRELPPDWRERPFDPAHPRPGQNFAPVRPCPACGAPPDLKRRKPPKSEGECRRRKICSVCGARHDPDAKCPECHRSLHEGRPWNG